MNSKINFKKAIWQCLALTTLIHGGLAVQQCDAEPLPADSGIVIPILYKAALK
jgi:hypothetical protein